MDRPITGFELDAEGAWVALLSCGHRQHVRHEPPFTNRAWVTNEVERDRRLGAPLPCVPCDRFELPAYFVPYHRTPLFSEATVPAKLTSEHRTKVGVWARIVVTEGRLRYHVQRLGRTVEVGKDEVAVVVSEDPHLVEPLGAVQFYVEFFRAPGKQARLSSPLRGGPGE